MKKTTMLIILDGFGLNPSKEYNAIAQASTPTLDFLFKTYPNSALETSGPAVGLPVGQMGNSEVGHMTIGAGRVVYQDLERINNTLSAQDIINATSKYKTIHLVGLISDGGVHSHIAHIKKIYQFLVQNNKNVVLHAITDGRDTPPKSAIEFINELDGYNIGTISGRYYAMDRDNRWERSELYYNAIVHAQGKISKSAVAAINDSYNEGITDEFIMPHVVEGYEGIGENEVVLIANFRSDRVIQLATSLSKKDFSNFDRKHEIIDCIGMTDYGLNLKTLFPKEKVQLTLGEVIAENHLRQLRIAETEKYPHVTYFFNCGKKEEFDGEDRILIPSPKVATYDLKPEMSALELTDKLIPVIEKYDFICVNYANADMVGHSGDIEATIKAVEAVDECLGKIINAADLNKVNILITADHGNAELMRDQSTLEPFTSHTTFKVPFIYVSNNTNLRLKDGTLADIAPTILEIMKLKKPSEMSGKSLI